MSAHSIRRLLFSAVCLGCAGLATITLTYLSIAKLSQRWDFDPDWAEANIRVAAPIQEALERYRNDQGSYPSSLAELVPGYLVEVPVASSSHRVRPAQDCWWYMREPDGQYRLCTTAMHWGSSFDAIVYRPSQYPDAWRRECYCIDVNGWIYVVGLNQRLRRPEPCDADRAL